MCRAGCGGFAGAATTGRWSFSTTAVNKWGSGLVWWTGDNWGDLEILFHEIGHNYGMAHASIPGGCSLSDQCDHTCTMGAAGGQGIRCFNAPHNWQVGAWRGRCHGTGRAALPIHCRTSVRLLRLLPVIPTDRM